AERRRAVTGQCSRILDRANRGMYSTDQLKQTASRSCLWPCLSVDTGGNLMALERLDETAIVILGTHALGGAAIGTNSSLLQKLLDGFEEQRRFLDERIMSAVLEHHQLRLRCICFELQGQ